MEREENISQLGAIAADFLKSLIFLPFTKNIPFYLFLYSVGNDPNV